jgi:FkbM family methyltransferase
MPQPRPRKDRAATSEWARAAVSEAVAADDDGRGRIVLRLPNGLSCVVPPQSAHAAKYLVRSIFTHDCYNRAGFELRPSDTVVDVGSHVGLFALWAAPQIPQGRLVAVEPNPVALGCLTANLRDNRLDRAAVVAAAAGSDGGVAEICYRAGWEAMAYSAEAKPPWFYTDDTALARLWWKVLAGVTGRPRPTLRRLEAPRLSLGRIMDEHRLGSVHYLKVDCEGSEHAVIRNIGADYWPRIERMVIEYHDSARDGRMHSELISLLRDRDFEVETTTSWICRYFLRSGFGTIWARNRAFRPSADRGRRVPPAEPGPPSIVQ